MKAKSTLAAIMFAAIILFSVIFVPSASATTDESMEKWTKDHAVKNVKLTTIYKYEEGYLEINEIYSGNELKKKTGLNEFNKEMKIPLETGTVMVNSEGDELTVTENELILKTKKDGTIKLKKGKENVYTTETSLVMTHESDPYQWWNNYPGPQWTYSKVLWWYVQEDPINLIWEDTEISTIEGMLAKEYGWNTNPSEYTHYIYDYEKKRWIADNGVAESKYRITGGDHARLWKITLINGDVVIANAHHDDGIFEWPFGHQAVEYENVETWFRNIYDGNGWTVNPFAYYFHDTVGTYEYGAYNDGYATLLSA